MQTIAALFEKCATGNTFAGEDYFWVFFLGFKKRGCQDKIIVSLPSLPTVL